MHLHEEAAEPRPDRPCHWSTKPGIMGTLSPLLISSMSSQTHGYISINTGLEKVYSHCVVAQTVHILIFRSCKKSSILSSPAQCQISTQRTRPPKGGRNPFLRRCHHVPQIPCHSLYWISSAKAQTKAQALRASIIPSTRQVVHPSREQKAGKRLILSRCQHRHSW
jgi:hypothetical protein